MGFKYKLADVENPVLYTYKKSDYCEFRRHDSALQDGSDQNVNLTGGYYDAG